MEKEESENVVTVVKPVSDVLFSRKTVEDSFINKVVEGKPAGIPIANLDKRLELLSH